MTDPCSIMLTHTPGLQLECPLLPRDLEAVWVVFIGGLLHLHALHSDPASHSKTLPDKAKLRNAAEQKVVEL